MKIITGGFEFRPSVGQVLNAQRREGLPRCLINEILVWLWTRGWEDVIDLSIEENYVHIATAIIFKNVQL